MAHRDADKEEETISLTYISPSLSGSVFMATSWFEQQCAIQH